MPTYKDKPESCKDCPAYSQGKSFIPGNGNPNAVVAYVGQGPDELSAIQGKPFVGDDGIKLDDWNYSVDIKRQDCWFTNIVQCWLTKRTKNGLKEITREATAAEITYCLDHHVKPELLKLPNLKVVIPVGIPAMKVFIGEDCNERDAGSHVRFGSREAAIRAIGAVRHKRAKSNKQAELVPQLPGIGCIRVHTGTRPISNEFRVVTGAALSKV